MKNTVRAFSVVALLLLAGAAANLRAEELNLDFKLVNSTGRTIKAIYIGPTSSDEWGDNILKGTLKDGETLDVTFHPKATATKWDIRIEWADKDGAVEWTGFKLTDITSITLMYDEETKKTTAKTE